MRHGIGSKAQHSVLLEAGVERIWSPAQVAKVLSEPDIALTSFRSYDTIVMVQPKLLTAAFMSKLARYTPSFEILGHSALDASTMPSLSAVRELSPMVEAAMETRKGGNVRYNQPSSAQLNVIVGYWHGSMKPSEFMPLIREMMGESELPNTVVRDWVKRATGNTKRDPNAPGKHPVNLQD